MPSATRRDQISSGRFSTVVRFVARFDFAFDFAFDRLVDLVDLRATVLRFARAFAFDLDFDFIDHFEGAASAGAGSEVAVNATATTSSSVRNMRSLVPDHARDRNDDP